MASSTFFQRAEELEQRLFSEPERGCAADKTSPPTQCKVSPSAASISSASPASFGVPSPCCVSSRPPRSTASLFRGRKLVFAAPRAPKVQLEVLRQRVKDKGGEVHDTLSDQTTDIVIGNECSTPTETLLGVKRLPATVQVHTIQWLTESLRHGGLLTGEPIPVKWSHQHLQEEPRTFEDVLNSVRRSLAVHETATPPTHRCASHSSESSLMPILQPVSTRKKRPRSQSSSPEEPKRWFTRSRIDPRGFSCQPHRGRDHVNNNAHITDVLEEIVSAYNAKEDEFRVQSYRKAIAALKRFPRRIESAEEARSLKGIGARTADKIEEILSTGTCDRVHYLASNEDLKVLRLLSGVWGTGPVTARKWMAQGIRTLEDVRAKAKLTRQQEIGLQHYEEFQGRIVRSESEAISQVVAQQAELIRPGAKIVTCGSFRRGKLDSGDVDIMITHPDGSSHTGVMDELLEGLKTNRFVTHDLTRTHDEGQEKWLGVCQLPGGCHRRLDIITVPFEEEACALLYFTGSDHFNRSMRLYAKKIGYTLTHHSLTKTLRAGRKGEGRPTDIVWQGPPIPCDTEEAVFAALGLEYVKPEDRSV